MRLAAAPDVGVVVGLMSGTSLDGVTAAAVRFTARPGRAPGAELLAHLTTPYGPERRERLASALEGATPAEYCRLAFDLGAWLAEAAGAVMTRAGLAPADVAAIASHGQTLWHEAGHSTWQAGAPAVIAERTGVPVVSDFRARDVAAGGQGAPLVPIADALLFGAAEGARALQNLGGIGNVTVVPAGSDPARVRAFDTGPGVAIIDGVVRRLLPGAVYDVDGALARAGHADDAVVAELLRDSYFASPPPKSTGRELFSRAYADDLIARCRASRPDGTVADVVATAVALTARSVADAYARWIPEPLVDVLLSGGGARNPVLRAALADALAPQRVRLFEEAFFDGDAKEAVAFALLGWLHLRGEAGNVPSATGARGARVLGSWTPA